MSRKIKLLLLIIMLSTIGAFIPPLVTWILTLFMKRPVQSFTILTDGDWVTVISLVVSAYMGANVAEKHVALSNGFRPKDIDGAVMDVKGTNTAKQIAPPIPVEEETDEAKQALKDKIKHGD